MRVVVDTNILIAGLLKDSTIRKILLDGENVFYLPAYSLVEIKKYEDYLLDKSGLSCEEFLGLMNSLLKNIKVIPLKKFSRYMKKADRIMLKSDLDDSSFVALALAIRADGIWTFDKHFLMQRKIRIISTAELLNRWGEKFFN
jgi:predicted nucleic acid-binding protein